ncbi:hypothetical protein HZC33_02860 [Candidatus Wolfebacteria bacterium]|nr:hypothetical protein [Candidatus Wolfebacteria bacterium]
MQNNQLIIKIAVSLILILILASALVFVGFDISKKNIQIKDLRQAINLRSELIKNLSVLRSDYNQVEPFKSSLDGLLVNKDKLIEFPRDLNALAAQTKISFTSSFSGEELSPGGLGWFGLAMAGDASFDNFIQFVKYLENGKYFLQFDNFDISGKDNNFRIMLNGRIFYFVK